MAFTAGELSNISSAALDFYIKGPAFAQSIQDKPLLNALMKNQKTFSGGAGNISIPVQFDFDTSSFAGYTHNDTVAYSNPANLKRALFPWKEIHAGISLTLTELKIDGLSVTDSETAASTSRHSDRDIHVLTGLLENKLSDMGESWARAFDSMLHKDGTQDSKQVPGIGLLISDTPTTGTVGGINRASVPLWRNRALVGGSKITASTSLQTLSRTLRAEVRQLKRYGGTPNLILAGSQFLALLEMEIQALGQYTTTGFTKTTDMGITEISMNGVGTFMYDPTLDDLSKSDYCYIIDTKNVFLDVMEGEDRKTHTPARPYNQYVMYRAMTWTGGLCAKQLNGCGVYQAA